MRVGISAAIAVVFTVAAIAPAGADAVAPPEVKATHHRAKSLVSCAPDRPIGNLIGSRKFEFVRTVAGFRLWRKDGRKGPSITYCLEVNNSYDDSRGTVTPEGSGIFRVPKWMRRDAESVQVVTNEQCGVGITGMSGKQWRLWSLDASGFRPRPTTRRWRWLELSERVDDRTVYISWSAYCDSHP